MMYIPPSLSHTHSHSLFPSPSLTLTPIAMMYYTAIMKPNKAKSGVLLSAAEYYFLPPLSLYSLFSKNFSDNFYVDTA